MNLVFASIIRENHPVTDLLDANYTFLNERLAKHYGIPGIIGQEFRLVTLPADSVRAGLLGKGAILNVYVVSESDLRRHPRKVDSR